MSPHLVDVLVAVRVVDRHPTCNHRGGGMGFVEAGPRMIALPVAAVEATPTKHQKPWG